MSKKIKITEDQLKRLMVLKEENQGLDDFDTQIQPEELSSTDNEGMDDMNDSNDELERMVDSFIKQEQRTKEESEKLRIDLKNANEDLQSENIKRWICRNTSKI